MKYHTVTTRHSSLGSVSCAASWHPRGSLSRGALCVLKLVLIYIEDPGGDGFHDALSAVNLMQIWREPDARSHLAILMTIAR